MDTVEQVWARIEESMQRLGLDVPGAERDAAVRAEMKNIRTGSRFVGPGPSPSLVEHVAKGGSYSVEPNESRRPRATRGVGGGLVFGMKALAEGTGSAGGYLVPVEIADEVVKLLRARSAVNRLGPTTVPVEKELDITSIASGATAYWVAENAAIPVSEQTFALSALFRPKDLASLVPVSDRLLRDAACRRTSSA
jgi:HK97 family phage major capsid protein